MDYELNIKLNALNNATPQINSVNQAVKVLNDSMGKSSGDGLDKFGKSLESTGSRINVMGQRMSWMVTVPLLGFANAAIKTAIDIDTAWVRLDKIWTGTKDDLDSLKKSGESFSNKFGVDVENVTQILTDFTSAGIDSKDMLNQLTDITLQTAKLYNIDTKDAFTNVKSIMYGFNLTADQTKQAMADIYAIGIKTTASEEGILNMFTKTSGVAREAGYSYEALASAEAVFEKNAIPAGKAGNAMKTIIQSLGVVTPKTAAIFNQFGLDIGSNAWKVSTAEEKMQELAKSFEKVKLSGDKLDLANFNAGLTKLVGKMQANQITVLLEDMGLQFDNNADTISQFSKAMGIGADKTGNMSFMGKNLNTVMDAETTKLAQLNEEYRNASARIGNDLLPLKVKLMEAAIKVLDAFNNLSPAMQKWIVYIGIAVAAAGPLLAIIGLITTTVGFAITAFAGLASIMGDVAIFIALGIAPVSLLIIAWAAVGVAVIALGILIYTHWEQIKQWTFDMIEKIKMLWGSIVEYFKTKLFNDIGVAIGFLVGAVILFWPLVLRGLEKLGAWMWDNIFVPAWNYLSDNFPKWIDSLVQWFKDLPNKISSALSNLGPALYNAFKGAFDWLGSKWDQLTGGIGKGFSSAMQAAGLATGGIIPQYFAGGGLVYAANGYMPRGNDTIPAMLSPGEMVLNSNQQGQLWNMLQGKSQGSSNSGATVNISVGNMIASRGEQREFARQIKRLLTEDNQRY